jgi:hypothetical protein
MTQPVLFLSLTETLNGLARGTISDDELATGLFCLLTNSSWLRLYGTKTEAHKRFAAGMAKAQQDGRIIWLDEHDGRTPYERLNDMFAAHGYKKMRFYAADRGLVFTQTEVVCRCDKRLRCVYRAGS